jgi:Ankyrin repeats (3 copies)
VLPHNPYNQHISQNELCTAAWPPGQLMLARYQLLFSVISEKPETLRIMARLGVDVKERLFGRTALHFAAITDANTIILQLISAGVSVDVKTENTGCTPLYIAVLQRTRGNR